MGKKASSSRRQIRAMQREAKNRMQAEAKKNRVYKGYTGRITQLANGDVVPQAADERKDFQGSLGMAKNILDQYRTAKSS